MTDIETGAARAEKRYPSTEDSQEVFAIRSFGREMYAEGWDAALAWQAAQQSETREFVVPCARCGVKNVIASDALNGEMEVCGRCGIAVEAEVRDDRLSAALTQAREALNDREQRGMCLSAGEGAVIALRALVAAIEEGGKQ